MKKSNKFIDFLITQKCTFKCEYCSQSKRWHKHLDSANDEIIESFFRLLNTIDKDFEITLSGGEALLHPRFFEIIQTTKERGFKINLISNFSFELEKYKKIVDILDDSLLRMDISLHLDEIKNLKDTISKIDEFLKHKHKNTKITLLIPVYKINDKKRKKIELIKQFALLKNIPVDFQHIRILNKKIKYSKKESPYIKTESSESTFAKLCFAGVKSAVIYEDGSVYRCYSSRFLKSNYLGNIKDKNFKLKTKPQVCTMKYCNCPKPKQYGQITNKKAPLKAYIYKIANFIFVPFLMIKKRKLIKAKIKQLLFDTRNKS